MSLNNPKELDEIKANLNKYMQKNSKNKLKRYWVSWWQQTADYRPLKDPPQPTNIKAWWNSGGDFEGNSTLCAVVEAENGEKAQEYILQSWQENDGEVGEFRFVDEVEKDWLPNDRFPITKDWQKERLGITK